MECDRRQGDGGLFAGRQQNVHLALAGHGMSSLASLMRLSVTPLMAETTTTTRSPWERYFATRAATFVMRWVLPTDVPPYF